MKRDLTLSARQARRLSRKSCAALLWGLASFAVLEAALALAVNCWLPYLCDPVYGWKRQGLLRQLRGPAPMLVVAVGTSRMAYGLDGQCLGQSWGQRLGRRVVAFNFGIVGGGSLTELLTVRRLLREGIRPDVLLVEVLPALLAGQQSAPRETLRFFPNQFQHDEQALALRFGMRGLRRSWRRSWLLPCYEHRLNFLNWTMPALLPEAVRRDWPRGTDGAGWLVPPPGEVVAKHQHQAAACQALFYLPHLVGFALGGPGCEALRELLRLCQVEGIPVWLVLMPEATTFRALYPTSALLQIDHFLAGLKGEFGVQLIDARPWMPDETMADGHHLHRQGAEAFTERLARELIPSGPPALSPQEPPKAARAVPGFAGGG
jgi:hypothetical protein